MSTSLRRTFFVVTGLILMLIVSACGGTSSTASTQSTPATTPTSAPTATPVPATIQTAQATVDGKAETILTDAQGSTLYYYTPDAPTKLACSGECAVAWPPLIAKGSGTPLADAPLTGTLSTFNNANGNQVEYNGHLLYTFIKDAVAGQITGQGVGGKWFVATPALAA